MNLSPLCSVRTALCQCAGSSPLRRLNNIFPLTGHFNFAYSVVLDTTHLNFHNSIDIEEGYEGTTDTTQQNTRKT